MDDRGKEGKVYTFPPPSAGRRRRRAGSAPQDQGSPDSAQEGTGRATPRASRKSRLSKTAAGLALIVGTGGSVASLAGADNLASARGAPTGVAARVVDITQLSSARRGASSPRTGRGVQKGQERAGSPSSRGPEGPTDDGGPSAA